MIVKVVVKKIIDIIVVNMIVNHVQMFRKSKQKRRKKKLFFYFIEVLNLLRKKMVKVHTIGAVKLKIRKKIQYLSKIYLSINILYLKKNWIVEK